MTAKSTVLDQNFEEIEEPSVASSDPNERKFARQLRIQKRVQALQKLNEDNESNFIEETLTDKQIRVSEELLQNLIDEGNEVITNVRVANDAREIERQKEAGEIYEKLLKRLEKSKEECKKQYDIVNARWPSILESKDPLDIHNAMKSQAEKCDQILSEKDVIIEELKQELERADNVYFQDQKKQKDDIKLLTERIDNQINTMESAYNRELQLIEKTLKTERDTLVNNYQKQWDDLYKQEQDEDHIGDKKLVEIMREYEEEMERIRRDHDENFRAQKIMLDKECQSLQQEVEKTKALCLLNVEKLSYNYTVLKNREEENSIVKSQQKRQINKLQNTINALKQEYLDLETSTNLEIEKLTNQILKAHKNILELEEKSNLFTRANEKQYLDIWDMNTDNANKLVEQILAADRIIHERTLGILWEPPEKTLPKKEDMPSYNIAMDAIQKRKQEEAETYKMFEYEQLDQSSSEAKLERKVLNNILKQISNCSKYLIEDKLQELILNRSDEEKTIIQLDNIFQALSLSSPEEINVLLNFFLPYSYCVICSEKEETISSVSSTTSSSLKTCECHIGDKEKKLIDSVKEEIGIDSQSSQELEKIKSESTCWCSSESSFTEAEDGDKKQTETKPSKFTCDKGHVLEIQTIHVTKAIKDIVTKFSDIEQKNKLSFEQRLKEKKYTISLNLSEEDVKSYWSKYREIFDEDKEKLWDLILIGLNKYYEALQERYKLCTKIESVRRQNDELRRLLQSYITCPEDGSSQEKSAKNSSYQIKVKI